MNSRLSWRERFAFAMGDAGSNFIWQMVGSFLMVYLTDSVGIAAGTIGTLMLITRLFDGFTDVGMGLIIDKTNTRMGKVRPWILISAPFMAIGLIAMFNVPGGMSDVGKVAYASITYILLAAIIYTACNLSVNTLLSLITASSEERTLLTTVRFIFVQLIGLFVNYNTIKIVAKVGWSKTSVIYAVVGLVMLLCTALGTRERVTVSEDAVQSDEAKLGTGKAFKILLKNKYFIIVTLLFCINYISLSAFYGTTLYFARDVLGSVDLNGTLVLARTIPPMLGLFLFPSIANRFGKWKCMMVGYTIQLISYLIIFFAAANPSIVIAAIVMRSIGYVPLNAGMFALVADVSDYGEWKTGYKIEGLTFSAVSFGMKVGTGLGGAILGWGLDIGKYDPSLTIQTAGTIKAITTVYAMIPAIGCLLGLILLSRCNLDKFSGQMAKDLAERRGN